jgi:hypothetical protein
MPPKEKVAALPTRNVRWVAEKSRESRVCAVELVDFDLDDRLDVVVVRGRTVEVYSRGHEGRVWKSLTTVEVPQDLHGVVAADLDRDFDFAPAADGVGRRPSADWDLIAYGPGGLGVLENVLDEKGGSRSLKRIPQPAAWKQLRSVLAPTAVDLNHDGHLDLVASSSTGISLWFNRGDMTFDDLRGRASCCSRSRNTRGCRAVHRPRRASHCAMAVGSTAVVSRDGGIGPDGMACSFRACCFQIAFSRLARNTSPASSRQPLSGMLLVTPGQGWVRYASTSRIFAGFNPANVNPARNEHYQRTRDGLALRGY